MTEKSRENYLRRALKRQGFALKKSRSQTWTCNDHQGYMIINPYYNIIEAGEKYDLSLEDVERFVQG